MSIISASSELSARSRWSQLMCISPSGLHRMAYQEWGDSQNPNVVVCVHGLTRTSEDFLALAQALRNDYRVIAPDVVGRGRSGRLKDPMHYGVPQYVSDMVALIARLNVTKVKWIGTSMGGLIGMALAPLQDSPIERLVLNDVGAVLSGQALQRIGQYVGEVIEFESREQAHAVLRRIYAGFGPHSDDQWARLLDSVLLPIEGSSKLKLHYDPGIAAPFKAAYVTSQSGQSQGQNTAQDLDLWTLYDAIACPTLLIRGKESDLVPSEVFEEMQRRGPRAKGLEVTGVGHAPTLMNAEQIAPIMEFLRG
jgi:pimeloyl-ACP methyl ester carboxylesterase